MSFSKLLHQYFRSLGCSAGALADASELSKSMISRYLSGDRTPSVQGRTLKQLAGGIARLSRLRPGEQYDADEVYRQFYLSLSGIEISYDDFVDNLSLLMSSLEMTNSEVARALNFDPSYISRILVGQRRPADLPRFLSEVAHYVARTYRQPVDIASICDLTGCTPAQAADPEQCALELNRFLGSAGMLRENPVQGFLSKLDAFDLDEYIRAIPFDGLPEPAPGPQIPRTRHYRGLEQMMEAELDFLRLTIQSRARDEVFSYSEMPMEQMAQNGDFLREWIYSMALLLKKGPRLHVIHDVQRPLREMLMGLEAWIPLYMTGQITPYCLTVRHNDLFLRHIKVSGAAVLTGDAIAGHHAEGRYSISNSREDLLYYRSQFRLLLRHAQPLMEIYTKRQQDAYAAARGEWLSAGNRRMLFSSIPLFAAERGTLESILRRAEVEAQQRESILDFAAQARKTFSALLRHADAALELPLIEAAEYEAHPVSLSLSELFFDRDVVCTYEEYRALLAQTEEFAHAHPRLTLRLSGKQAFRNMDITVVEGTLAVVSKSKSPTIHFVIRHERMVDALYRFAPPVYLSNA